MNGCIYRTADGKCEFWSDYGKGIVSYCDFEDCEEKKPSNADRIRSMTDEELAAWIANIAMCNHCQAKNADTAKPCKGLYVGCKSNWLDWLKQEAE